MNIKEENNLNIEKNLLYRESHEWVNTEDEKEIIVGISDYAQEKLGDIVFIDFLVDVGDAIEEGDPFAELESVKAVESVYAPVTGTISAINGNLDDDYSVVNEKCYSEGWLIKMNPADVSTLGNLLKAEDYEKELD